MTGFPQPAELTEQVFTSLETKAEQPLGRIAVLGVLAGVYIGLGGLFATLALAGADALPFGFAQVLAGVVFSLGLAAVLVAGAELFTGNTLMAGPVLSGRLSLKSALRALSVAYIANLAGSLLLAGLVFLSGFHSAGNGEVGRAAMDIATTKTDKAFLTVIASGVLANLLVCLGVWMALTGETVTQKIAGLLLPVSAFVAAGFEHSIANMYLLPYAYLTGIGADGATSLTMPAVVSNIIAATLGNIIGGTALAAMYALAFRPVRS